MHFLAFFPAGFANLNSLTWLLTTLQQRADEGDKAKMASCRLLAIGLATAALMPLIGRSASASPYAGFWSLAGARLFALAGAWAARIYTPAFSAAGPEEPQP